MDPNVALEEIREQVEEFEGLSDDNFVDALRAADRIVEQFKALDEWLSKGGFKPAAWEPQPQQFKPGFEGAVLAGAVNTPEELDSWKQGGE